ncbi:hypothetical protein TTRE_0000767501 [Trichuris trichiura]|uniref:Uncharacterized protein n=1 Tax=Trichuris trichiura TaxID=36087 RepID=A0A077ZIC0_TRITR|nr:hypothetical protein TTRE_0000767501 [Trichuris trichiura]
MSLQDELLELQLNVELEGRLPQECQLFWLQRNPRVVLWRMGCAEVTNSSLGGYLIAASIKAFDAVLWISSSWNKVQPEALRKCFKRAGFFTDQDNNVEHQPGSLIHKAEVEAADFEDFIAMDG